VAAKCGKTPLSVATEASIKTRKKAAYKHNFGFSAMV
jgi:hypothetical protein